jgi:hypothetical protein
MTIRSRTLLTLMMLMFTAGLFPAFSAVAKKTTFEPDLTKLEEGKDYKVTNRSLSHFIEGARKGIRFEEKRDVGLARFAGFEVTNGVIEFDARGKNVLQKSFVGIAFHGIDEQSYDAIYFRPFNFRSDDPLRRSHAVQYISMPDYSWQKLRNEHPGVYEQPIQSPPDPEAWFHVRIVVDSPNVNVFVNGAKAPSLMVKKLNTHTKGWIGLWVGDESGGDFANLKVVSAQ